MPLRREVVSTYPLAPATVNLLARVPGHDQRRPCRAARARHRRDPARLPPGVRARRGGRRGCLHLDAAARAARPARHAGPDGLYDAQAHALLGGHWDVPAGKLGFEAFLIDGKTVHVLWALACAPTPADRGDHRQPRRGLTQVSILAPSPCSMVATVRPALAGPRAHDRATGSPARSPEQWAAGVFVLVVGRGLGDAVPREPAGRLPRGRAVGRAPWRSVRSSRRSAFVARAPGRRLAWREPAFSPRSSLMSRAPSGSARSPRSARCSPPDSRAPLASRRSWDPARRLVHVLGLPTASGLGATSPRSSIAIGSGARALHVRELGEVRGPVQRPARPPLHHVHRPDPPPLYAGDQGSLFSGEVPPDRPARDVPARRHRPRPPLPLPHVPGDGDRGGRVTYASLDPSSSIPSSMPFLFLLASSRRGGCLPPVARPPPGRPRRCCGCSSSGASSAGSPRSRSPTSTSATGPTSSPLLVVLGAAGLFAALHVLVRSLTRIRAQRTHRRRAGWATAIGPGGNARSASRCGRTSRSRSSTSGRTARSPLNPNGPRSCASARARSQPPRQVDPGRATGPRVPAPGPADTVFVLGDCDGVYCSDGRSGSRSNRPMPPAVSPSGSPSTTQPARHPRELLVAGPPGEADAVFARARAQRRGRFVFYVPPPRQDSRVGDTITVGPGARSDRSCSTTRAPQRRGDARRRFGEGFQWDAYASPVTVAGDGSDAASAPHFLRDARLDLAADFCRDLVG